MQALLGALISSTGFGTANIVIKKSLEDVTIARTLFMSFISGTVVLLMYTILTGSLSGIDTSNLLIPALLACGEIMLYLFLYKAFASSNVTVATALINLYPILTTFVAIFALGAVVPAEDWIFIVMMIFGAGLVGIDWAGVRRDGFDKKDLTKGLAWIVLAIIAHAIYFPALGSYTSSGDLFTKLLLIKSFATVIFFIGSSVLQRVPPVPARGKVLPLSLLGLLEVIGWIGFSWAVGADVTRVGIVTAALNLAAIVTAVEAYFFLKERLRLLQYAGIVVIVIALTLQSI
ncbi:MAG: EamA-like transporter family protein [candidate division WS6 bacterium OLB20]|uniref:EamA-like transporter family protein n=1 Tax=candidate division WS6 bacterium OLB20 TaxID=1617426 RepID=A0A136LZB5_9BACT|nr:MAG: EamA-like transporter family protein [candidate division WS6 bacterium OLB20]